MTFTEAFQMLEDGRRVARPNFNNNSYLIILATQPYIWQVNVSTKSPGAVNYVPSIDDLNATDWIILS